MDEEKPEKEIPQGIYILFKVTGDGKVVSQMKLEKATLRELSNALVWCDLTKEELLQHFKNLTKKGYTQNIEDE